VGRLGPCKIEKGKGERGKNTVFLARLRDLCDRVGGPVAQGGPAGIGARRHIYRGLMDVNRKRKKNDSGGCCHFLLKRESACLFN